MTNIIETNRLFLRRPALEDAVILKGLWRDEKVREFLGGVLLDEAIQERIAALQNHWEQYNFGLWAVFKRDFEEPIGLCGLHHTQDGLELSYLFFPKYWGQGLAREATHACLNYGFAVLKQNFIISITQEANLRSRYLLERMGMKPTHKFERYNALQCLYKLSRDENLLLP